VNPGGTGMPRRLIVGHVKCEEVKMFVPCGLCEGAVPLWGRSFDPPRQVERLLLPGAFGSEAVEPPPS